MALDEDFAELLLDIDEDDLAELLLDRSSTGVEDDERTLLLDFAELLLDFALELDFAELLEATLDDECTELLDFALLLDTFDSADTPLRVTLEEDGSSSRGAKLLSSSPQPARKNAKASAKMQIKEKRFIIPQIVCRKYRKA